MRALEAMQRGPLWDRLYGQMYDPLRRQLLEPLTGMRIGRRWPMLDDWPYYLLWNQLWGQRHGRLWDKGDSR